MLNTQQINQLKLAKSPTSINSQPMTPDEAKASFSSTPTQPQGNNGTGQSTTVPMDWGKVLQDTWSTYQNATSDFIAKEQQQANNPDVAISKNKTVNAIGNNILKTGEATLAGMGSVLNTIFAPFGATAKGLTDSISKTIESDPNILTNPMMGHIADFVQKSSDQISKLNPRAMTDLGNALTVAITALSGKAGEGLTGSAGLDSKILPGTFGNPAPLLDAAKQTVTNVASGVKSGVGAIKDTTNNALDNVKNGVANKFGGGTPEEIALKNATPKLDQLTPKQRTELLKGQNINPETGLKGGTVNLTPEQTNLVKSNVDLFQGKTATDNYYNVDNRIAENDMAIKAHLDEQGATFNKVQLKKDLIKATKDITDPLNEKRFEVAKGKLIDNVVNSLEDKKSSTLLNGRQAWDKSPAIKSQLEGLFSGKETSKGLFGKSVRDTMNTTINKSLGSETYSDLMKQSSGLIDIRDNNLLQMAKKTMTKSQLTQWIKNTPGVKQAIKLGRLGGIAEILHGGL